MTARRRPLLVPLAAALAVTALAACAPADEAPPAAASSSGTAGTAATASSAADVCAKDLLAVRTKGTLTVGTDKPAYEPWFVGDPTSGKGFESAVAYAVADRMGFAKAEVRWQVVSFNAAIAPGPKRFDIDINQVSITPERAKNLDFSTGYYDVAQSVVTVKGSKAENAASVADLKKLKLGAAVGTTSYSAAKAEIAPTQTVAVFNSNDDAKAALTNGQVDALVVDLPTGLFLAAADLKGGKLVGQLPVTGSPEQFGLVLDKGSKLTPCVSKAVDALRADGTLTKLQQQWLADSVGAPELK